MRKALFCFRVAFLLASLLFAGASLFPVVSGASLGDTKTPGYRCHPTYCGPSGPIYCGGICRRPE